MRQISTIASEVSSRPSLKAIDFDQQRRPRIARITGLVNRSFHGFDRLVVHELERRGHDPGRDNVRDGLAAGFDGVKCREQRLHGLWLGKKANDDLRDDRKRAFRSDDRARQDPVPRPRLPEFPSRTISPSAEHRFNLEDVVRRHAILQAVRAAGILRNVAADAAGHLA